MKSFVQRLTGPEAATDRPRRREIADVLQWGVAGAVGLVVLWGSGRSFDFTDEGSYYLNAVHPEEMPDRQTTYFLFGRALFALSGHNIAVTRALMAGLVLAATLVLVRGLRRFLAAFAPPLDAGGWLIAAALAGSAMAFATSPVAPSYNLLNAICLLAATGLVFEGAGAAPSEGWVSRQAAIVPLLLAAALIVADFFIKFSTSVVLAAGLALFFLVASRERVRNKIALVMLTGLLGLLAAGTYLFIFQDLKAWREGIGGTLLAVSNGPYLEGQLLRYWQELRVQIIQTLWDYESVFTAMFVTGGGLLILRWWPRLQRWGAAVGGMTVIVIGIQAVPAKAAWESGTRFHLAAICVLGLAAGITWLVRASGARSRLAVGAWRALSLLILLALLPFVGSFGTSNNLNTNVVYQFAPWLALIALLLAWLAHAWQARWLSPIGVALIAALTLSQFFNGYVFNPYRIPGGRLAQTMPTAIGYPVTMLKLDPASHAFVEEVRRQLRQNGFKPGDDIFAFFNLPGLVFAVGGVSPGYPWFFAGDENSLALDAMRANWVPARRRARAFIVLNRWPDAPPPPWSAMYMNFPDAYEKCGPAFSNPLTGERVEVWAPKKR